MSEIYSLLQSNPIVSAEWLNGHLNDGVIIDATTSTCGNGTGRSVYEAGHIPGAVHADLAGAFSDQKSEFPFTPVSSADFATLASTLGIGNDCPIVVYDDGSMMWATRFWWNLRLEGHTSVAVLDGGMAGWRDAHYLIATGMETRYSTSFTAERNDALIASTEQVAEASRAGSALIIDARPATTYSGVPSPKGSARVGHIPGAVNLPVPEVLGADGHIDTQAAKEKIEAIGALETDLPVITYCEGGVAASLAALLLASLGRFDAAVYDGSMIAWRADESLPMSRGEA